MRAALAPLSVLIRPRRTFASLAERPRLVWLFALAVLLVTLAGNLSVGMPHMLEMQEEAMRDMNVGAEVSAEKVENGDDGTEVGVRTPEDTKADADEDVLVPEGVQDTVRTMTIVGSYVFGGLGVVFGTLLLAGIVYGVSRIWSKEAAFSVVLGVVALAKMPDAVRNVVQMAYTAGTGSWSQHQGLGALAAPSSVTEAPSVAYALLSMVDVYAIWFVILLFLGLTVAVGLERRRAALLVAGFVTAGVLFAAGSSVLGGALMPV